MHTEPLPNAFFAFHAGYGARHRGHRDARIRGLHLFLLLMVAQQLLWNGALGGDKERRSVIGNVTSKVGSCDDNGSGRGYAYRASKAALNVASVSLSIDYRDQNVATVLLHPGWVRTRMTEGRGLIDADESARGLLEVCSWPSEKISGRWYDYKFDSPGEIIRHGDDDYC